MGVDYDNILKVNRKASEDELKKKKKANEVENLLTCSLEDLYKGFNKKTMKTSTNVSDSFGKTRTVEEIVTIEIKPGWKKGTKITFPEKGKQEAGVIPGDLIFVVDEKPHAVYKRDGNDLTRKSLDLTTLECLSQKNPERKGT